MIGLPEKGLPFANGENGRWGGERKKFIKSPNATESQRLMPTGPLGFEIFQGFGNGEFIPIVCDIHDAPTLGAGKGGIIEGVGTSAMWHDTALENKIIIKGSHTHRKAYGLRKNQ